MCVGLCIACLWHVDSAVAPQYREALLVSDDVPHLIFHNKDKDRGVFYVETFPWADEDAMNRAHQMPEVGAVWGPMGDGYSSMEFPTVEEVQLGQP